MDAVYKIITEFVAALNSIKLYPPNHPQALSRLDLFFESVSRLLEQEQDLTFFILDDDIIARDKPLPNPGLAGESFYKILNENGIERLTLLQGLPREQLYRFISDLAAGGKTSIPAASHIKLGKVIFDDGEAEKSKAADDRTAEMSSFKYRAAAELKKMYRDIQGLKMPDSDRAKKIVTDFIKIYDKSISPLKIIEPLKSDDEYTYVHITNVALLTICFADFLGFSGKHLEEIGITALLHDVGKMFIPDEILNKPGPLTVRERAVMETHTLLGAQYIGRQDNIPRLTMITALEHHIKFNGAGYPLIRKNWQPNIASQMVSIADVYDALRSKRPYHEAVGYDQIKTILREGRGTDFNPTLVENFLTMIER